MKAAALLLALASPALGACAANTTPQQAAGLPDAAPFDENANAAAQLAAASAEAAQSGRNVLVVFGANWCHDSRALAGWLESERFSPLISEHYQVVYIDVGVPQTGNGRNLEIAEMLGVNNIQGTPTLLILSSEGRLLNSPQDARGWRNAASRSGDAIFARLSQFAK